MAERSFQLVIRRARRRKAAALPSSWEPLVRWAMRDLGVDEAEAKRLVRWARAVCAPRAPAW